MGALERARGDVEAGRLWKARDRLTGALAQDRANQEVLGLLGEVCLAMGDLPAAGLYWSLTERELPADVEAALRGRYGTAAHVLRASPARPPADGYPPLDRGRLEALAAEAKDDGYDWERRSREAYAPPPGGGVNLVPVLAVVLLLGVGVWVLGWVFLARLVF